MRGSFWRSQTRLHTVQMMRRHLSFRGDPQYILAPHRAGKEGGEIASLFVKMHRGEDQFDRPFGRKPFGLQRVGKAEATDRQIGARVAAAIQL